MNEQRNTEPDDEPEIRQDAGRLIEEGSGLADTEKDEVAEEAHDDREDRSAEEAAVRVEEDPGGLTDGPEAYVEEDEEPGTAS
jgi:uncharacterized protein DUF5709